MNKGLKIAGIVFGAFLLLVISFVVSQRTMMKGNLMYSQESDYAGLPGGSMGMSAPSGSDSVSFENPMSSGLPQSKMGATRNETAEYSGTTSVPMPDKKIIKDGDLTLKVDSVDKASADISKIAKNNGGEVQSSNFYQSGKSVKSGTITVKVPVANFEKTFSDLKKVASLVIRESTSGEDVTEQYTDLQAQLKNKQTEEEAFTRIMAQAQKIDDILAVQRELSRVRGQIEQLQGRIKVMDSKTDMSTITIMLSEDANISMVDKWRPWQVVKESASVLIKKVQNFIDFVIKLIILVLPVFLLYALLVFVLFRIGKKIYLKFKKKDQPQI